MLMKCDNSGYEMTYETSTGIYQLLEDGAVVKESKSLDIIEKYISSGGVNKEKKKHKRIPIIHNKSGDYVKGEATGVAEIDRFDRAGFWIVSNGNRSKVSTIILDTIENEAIIAQIGRRKDEMGKLREEIINLEKSFTYLTPKMMEE